MKAVLLKIFKELSVRIVAENAEREEFGTLKILPVEILIFGQMTLLANNVVAKVLPLQRTNDLDAVVKSTDNYVKDLLKKELLPKYDLVFDEDSEKIWIPPASHFENFCNFTNVMVKLLDAESALVSKAIKDKKKNKNLIIEAIASELFPNLIKRIEEHGGDLNYFLEYENGSS